MFQANLSANQERFHSIAQVRVGSIGRQRGIVLLRPFSDAPAPNRACILSMHTAFQFPEAPEDCSPAHHALTSSLLLYSLSRFPLYTAFQCSKVGRHSDEYYRDSVTLLLAQGGPSRILTYSTF